LIGEAAKNQAAMNPRNTIFDIKYVLSLFLPPISLELNNCNSLLIPYLAHDRRLIGRRYDDPIVKKDIESWPFKVVDQGGNPVVEVDYLGDTKTFSPQEISSMVLTKVLLINSIPVSDSPFKLTGSLR
jgi:heat shock 70kDa protein 1/2/6/8